VQRGTKFCQDSAPADSSVLFSQSHEGLKYPPFYCGVPKWQERTWPPLYRTQITRGNALTALWYLQALREESGKRQFRYRVVLQALKHAAAAAVLGDVSSRCAIRRTNTYTSLQGVYGDEHFRYRMFSIRPVWVQSLCVTVVPSLSSHFVSLWSRH
jgi:hypothetical protein